MSRITKLASPPPDRFDGLRGRQTLSVDVRVLDRYCAKPSLGAIGTMVLSGKQQGG